MFPAILLCLGILILLLTVDARTIMFMLLVLIPCAVVWWLVGWKLAVAWVGAYFAFRATRQRWVRFSRGRVVTR